MPKTRSPKSPASPPPVDLAGIDAALGAVVASGWGEVPSRLDAGLGPSLTPLPAQEVSSQVIPQQALHIAAQAVPVGVALVYPPLPVKDEPVLPARRERDDSQEPEPANKAILDIGLLSDFVTGGRSAQETADAAGVTINELHSALATTLGQVDPKELAKAMGVQIAATQLKAGAVFNALLADLVEDIRMGRAKADTKIELMKILKGVGRLEPKEDKGIGAGGGFTLNINVGSGEKPVIIESQ